jgi:transposase
MNKYKENLKMMDFSGKLNYRWNMIIYAKQEGISKAAKVYNTTRKTVRKWIKRYEEGGIENLKNKSGIEQDFPTKMPKKKDRKANY